MLNSYDFHIVFIHIHTVMLVGIVLPYQGAFLIFLLKLSLNNQMNSQHSSAGRYFNNTYRIDDIDIVGSL